MNRTQDKRGYFSKKLLCPKRWSSNMPGIYLHKILFLPSLKVLIVLESNMQSIKIPTCEYNNSKCVEGERVEISQGLEKRSN
jgi:hypothetical protein